MTDKLFLDWQKIIMEKEDENGKKYAESYLATIHSQLSAIFNHAIKFYGLKTNPAYQAGGMGNKGNKEMDFWTQEEYKKFIETMMNQPYYFYGFEILYWCGLRIGELLALTPADFDFEKKIVSINKSYQRINKKDVITEPKTIKSIRTIIMPDFLSDEIEDFIEMHYGIQPNQRIFPLTKRHFELQIKNGSKAAGVKTIRVHDLRHSHVSLLIEMGFSALAIAERLGHESIRITYHYAHLFPTRQIEMAEKLNNFKGQ